MFGKILHRHVADHHLQIFGDLHVVGGKIDRVIREGQRPTSGETQNRKTGYTEFAGAREGLEDIRRIATARKREQEVAGLREHRELCRKNVLVRDIVGEAGEHRSIRRQSGDAQSVSGGFVHAIEEIVGKVDGVGGTAAIAAEKHLAIFPPATLQGFNEPNDIAPVVILPDGIKRARILGDEIRSGSRRFDVIRMGRERRKTVIFRSRPEVCP